MSKNIIEDPGMRNMVNNTENPKPEDLQGNCSGTRVDSLRSYGGNDIPILPNTCDPEAQGLNDENTKETNYYSTQGEKRPDMISSGIVNANGDVEASYDHNEDLKTSGSSKFQKPISKNPFSKLFVPYSKISVAEILMLVIAIVCSIFSGLLLPYYTWTMGDMLTSLNEGRSMDFLLVRLAVTGALAFCANSVACFLLEYVAERVVTETKKEFIYSVLRQSPGWFDVNNVGTLSARLDSNIAILRTGIGMKLGTVWTNTTVMLGGIGVALHIKWNVALITCIGLIPCIAFGGAMGYFITRGARRVGSQLEQASSIAEEAFTNIRTVVSFGQEDKTLKRYVKYIDKADYEGVRAGIWDGAALGSLITSVFLMFTLGFYLSGKSAANSLEDLINKTPASEWLKPRPEWPQPSFKGGDAYVISMAVLISAFSFGGIAEAITLYCKGIEAASSIYEICELKSDIDPFDPKGKANVDLNGPIKFQNITFCYPSRPDSIIFKDFSLEITAGKVVAIVGSSGCGKSTLLQLLQRAYDPSSGSISVNSNNIKDLNVKWYRSRIGAVNQEPRLFHLTVEENIRLGTDKPLTMEEVIAAAQKANAAGFIESMPEKYQSNCGSSASHLSGGQKQRIAIARALVRNPDIYIFDEATSALDRNAERAVQKAMDELVSETPKTTLIVAHRLSTIRNADEIIVMQNDGTGSKVVQRGKHEELLKDEEGLYFKLVSSQDNAEFGTGEHNEQMNENIAHSLASGHSIWSANNNREGSTPNGKNSIETLNYDEAAFKLLSGDNSLQDDANVSLVQRIKNILIRKRKKNSYSILRALGMLRSEWIFYTAMWGSSLLGGTLFPVIGLLLSRFLSILFTDTPTEMREKVNTWSLYWFICSIALWFANFGMLACKEYLASKMGKKLRYEGFRQSIHQDIAFFDTVEHSPGHLSSILSGDVTTVTTAATGNIAGVAQGIGSLVVGVIIGILASWKLSLVLLVTFAVMIPANGFLSSQRKHSGYEEADPDKNKGDAVSHIFVEAVNNRVVVCSFGLEQFAMDKCRIAVEQLERENLYGAFTLSLAWGVSQSMQFFVFALALWYGNYLQDKGEATAVEVMEAIFPLIFAASGVGMAAMYCADAAQARKALRSVFGLIDTPSNIDTRDIMNSTNVLKDFAGNVDYKNVSFSYPTRPQFRVYKDLTFSIGAGERVALVGPSGCGKSTAIQLLLRFYDMENDCIAIRGENVDKAKKPMILADKKDIRTLDVNSLRSSIGIVSQEPSLFSMTIAENIRYSNPSATDAEIEQAARQANAHDFIMTFPDGYNTMAGKGGSQLSGGQKQRIAIARALIRQPKILILDEATSALDAESEKQVQATLDKVVAGLKRTTIMIAHRLSTIRNADKIVVLKNEGGQGSEVVEIGKHKELMAIPNGVYRNLVELATS